MSIRKIRKYIKWRTNNSAPFLYIKLFTFFILINCFYSNGQPFTESWSENIRCGNCNYEFLGADNLNYFLLARKNGEFKIVKFDQQFRKIGEKILLKKAGKSEYFFDAKIVDGKLNFFTKKYIGSSTQFFIDILDCESLTMVKEDVKLWSVIGELDTSIITASLYYSGNRLVVSYLGKNNWLDRCGYFMLDNEAKLISQVDFKFPLLSLGYEPENYTYEFNRFYLLTHTEEKVYGPKGDSLIRQYRIFYADDGDTIFHHSDLQFIHKSPQQAYFFISRKNRIDVFGFNNSTDGKYSLGFYHDQYDIVTGKQISRETKNFMLDAPDTAINLFLKDFYITNAFDRKSGLYVFAERATYNPKLYRYNIIRNPVYHQFNIDEGLVIHFSTENKLDWIQMVPKKQVFSSSYNTAASFESVIGKNALLVYNDNPRNHDLKDGEIPRSYHSDDATEIVMVSINDESMERFALVPQKNNNYHYFIPDKAAIINEKKIFLITESGGDYRFGTIEFK